MAISDILTPKMIVLGVTLASLIGMTPFCSGKSYDFYENYSDIGLSSKESASALESVISAYKKEVPNYNFNSQPLYAKTDEDNQILLLPYPYFGSCGTSCVPALLQKSAEGNFVYVKDMEPLNCRPSGNQKIKVICDHSSGLM